MSRVPKGYLPFAVAQISSEIAQKEAKLRQDAETKSMLKDKEIDRLKKELEPLRKYKAKFEKKKNRRKNNKKKH
jgi:hypothetical protein